ncbi:SMP-30/gluconolactonase/LRE family protein [Sulfitobacter sp. HNIBRBA3233]|uniref:SMP-30/gluconolactonase/LRE family protein n=1 Tax=Sulfitobacter marinivivus TaxID=3158558 RepID=UPI0032DFD0E3
MHTEIEFHPLTDKAGFCEGPVAMPDGTLIFVDIEGQTLSRLTTDNKVETIVPLEGGPNGVAIGKDGAAYVCNNGGVYTFVEIAPGVKIPSPHRPNYTIGSIQRVDLDTREVETLYDEGDDYKLIAPDDIVFDSHGGFYFTDTGLEDKEAIHKGALYYAQPDGSAINFVAQIPTANGVGLSPDGKTIYVSDTIFGRLWALEVTAPGKVKETNLPGMPGVALQTLPGCKSMTGFQWLDSLAVEAGGNICVGTIFNGGITVFAPDGSYSHVPLEDPFTTNLCFGGADMRDVWITASSTGTIYKCRWPRPGLQLEYQELPPAG